MSEDYCDFEEDDENSDDIILIGQAKTFPHCKLYRNFTIEKIRNRFKQIFWKQLRFPSYKKYAKELFEFYQESLKIY